MSFSEQMLEELTKRAEWTHVSLFEAATDYCEEHDIDPEEFVSMLDKNVVEMLKYSAVDARKVRRCVQEPQATLF